jgi:hypothetical protein
MSSIRRILSLALVAILVVGCASHTPPPPANGRMPDSDDETGSIAANVWYVPGRALVCGLGAISAGLVMTLTLGQSYEEASQLMHGGCSGPWVVGPIDIRQPVP